MGARDLADLHRALLADSDGERLVRELELRRAGAVRADLLPRYTLFHRIRGLLFAAFPERTALVEAVALSLWPHGMADGTMHVEGTPATSLPVVFERDALPSLSLAGGRRPGHVYFLSRPSMTIGRGSACDLVVREDTMSRKQALLERDQHGRTLVTDSGSTAGTRVNGEKIRGPVPLADGAAVMFNAVAMRFRDALPPPE